jgi:hypothetical protein
MSSGDVARGGAVDREMPPECVIDNIGEAPVEAPDRLPRAIARGTTPIEVLTCGWVVVSLTDRDAMKSSVELALANPRRSDAQHAG